MPRSRSRSRAARAPGSGTPRASKYLDALAGIAVNGLGPRPSGAHARASPSRRRKLIHTSNLFRVPEQERARREALRASPAWTTRSSPTPAPRRTSARSSSRACTATSAASRTPPIVVMEKAWHGRTLATLSATGSRKAQAGFEPLMGGFMRVPYNDLAAHRARRRQPVDRRGADGSAAGRGRHPRRRRRLPAQAARDLRPQAVAAHDRRGAERHRAHRQVVRAPVGRHRPRRDARSPRASARACRSAPASRAAPRRRCSSPATTAPRSAAARSSASPAITTLEVIEKDGLLEHAARMGERDQVGPAARARGRGRREGRPRHGPHDRRRARPPVRRRS